MEELLSLMENNGASVPLAIIVFVLYRRLDKMNDNLDWLRNHQVNERLLTALENLATQSSAQTEGLAALTRAQSQLYRWLMFVGKQQGWGEPTPEPPKDSVA